MPPALWMAPAIGLALMAAGPRILRGQGRGRDPTPGAPPERLPPAGLVCLAAVVLGAFALRLWLAATYPAHWSELGEVGRSLSIWDFLGREEHGNFQDRIHAPLQSMVTHGWVRVEEASGARFTLTALRLPSVVFGTLSVLLTARLGSALGSWRAGLGAAALMALTPQPSLISVPLEYYVLSAAGLAWFAERAATYAYEGRPVYRTLALSAAVALWSGYLNGIVVAPVAVGLLVTARRRGQVRGALYAAALTALLVAPLVALGLGGVRLYLHTVGYLGGVAGAGGHVHPQIDPTHHFSGGSFWLGISRLALALLGPVGALTGPLAAALLWRARARALPLLLAVAVFSLVGNRLAMDLQHYSPVFPAVMLAFAWGADGLPGLGARPRLRTLVVAALVAAGVASSHLAWPLHAATSAHKIFDYWDRGRFAAALAAEPPALPVLLLTLAPDAFRSEVCGGAVGGIRRQVACVRRQGEARGALSVQTIGERPVATVRGEEITRGRFYEAIAEAVQGLALTPPWSTGGWLTVRELPLSEGSDVTAPSLARFLESRCRSLFTTGGFDVMRCAPAPATVR